MLDAVLPTTAGVLCIESQAELTLVLARASGPIPQAATCRLRAVLVAAVSSRARPHGGNPTRVPTTVLYCTFYLEYTVQSAVVRVVTGLYSHMLNWLWRE